MSFSPYIVNYKYFQTYNSPEFNHYRCSLLVFVHI